MKEKFLLLVGLVVVIWSFYIFLNKPAPARYQGANIQEEALPTLKAGENTIPVEIADSDAERTLGLSGRESLAAGSGLLFLFDTPSKYGFWMKDMRFPIDIVWIDENWQVVSIDRGVEPSSYPQIYEPVVPAKFVLELNSGDASRLGIDTGLQLYLGGRN